MPHIHTNPGEHDHTASAFIVRIDGVQPRLLLHKHKILGVYMQIGGHIETDETPWQSVIHEIAEESGYEIGQLQILQPRVRIRSLSNATIHPQSVYHSTHPFKGKDHFHTDTAYAFVTDEEPVGAIAAGESTEMRLFTYDQLRDLDKDKIIENVREVGIYVMDVCLKEWHPISTTEFK